MKKVKNDKPRSIIMKLDAPMTEAEFEEKIVALLPTLRPIENEFLIVDFGYEHPWGVSFIQTLTIDAEEGLFLLECKKRVPEHPGGKLKGKKLSKMYRMPYEKSHMREVLEAFKATILGKGHFDISEWKDVTMEVLGTEYE